jgi:hypothetical protein
MRSRDTVLTRVLVYTALTEWLLARTLTRLGIFMPKSPALITVYQSLTLIGQAATTFAGLLVLAAVLVWARNEYGKGESKTGSILLASLVFLSILFLFYQPPVLLAVLYQVLLTSALAYFTRQGIRSSVFVMKKLAILTCMLALQSGSVGHLAPLLGFYEAGPIIFKVGECMIILCALFLWVAFGRNASRQIWFLAALPVMAFTVFRLVDPATSGILAIWSTGMTLFLPWPVYTMALWLVVITVLVNWTKRDLTSAGIILLISGGFAAQMTNHSFYGLVGIGLIGSTPSHVDVNVPSAGQTQGQERQQWHIRKGWQN